MFVFYFFLEDMRCVPCVFSKSIVTFVHSSAFAISPFSLILNEEIVGFGNQRFLSLFS